MSSIDDVERNDAGFPVDPLGEGDVRIDVDPDTYERLHAEYCRVLEEGYPDDFVTFVFNNCMTNLSVTVDGEPPVNDGGDDGGDA